MLSPLSFSAFVLSFHFLLFNHFFSSGDSIQVHCVDLGESFQTHIYLQNLASIQPADAGTAGPARPPALGAGRASAWLVGPASARGPRVPRSRRGVSSPPDRRGPCGTSATSGAGRGTRRRLAGGACDCSRPVSHPAPKQRGVVSLPSLTYCRGQPCRVRGGAHRPQEAPRCNFNPSAVPCQIFLKSIIFSYPSGTFSF